MGSCCGGSTEVDGWAVGCVGGRTSVEICSPVSVPIISLRPEPIHFYEPQDGAGIYLFHVFYCT